MSTANKNILRVKTYQLLESETKSGITAKLVTWLLIILIISNVAAAITSSDSDYYLLYKHAFILFETISLSIFCFEYLLRVWCCVEAEEYQTVTNLKARINYIFTPMALIDLIAILPFIIALFFSLDLRTLRLIRVLRLLKLTHYFKGFDIFITVITKELKNIIAVMIVMLFFIIIAASLIYSIEGKVQPETFGSIFESFWWAVVTMTTVGYGDAVPITTLGKVISTLIMLVGVVFVALPAGMLAARFGEELRRRKERLDANIKGALTHGYIDNDDFKTLQSLAEKLEIEPEDLQRSITMLKEKHHENKCPHCGK
ncbi:ion transporter [Colwellia sp. 4_MG-2023]|jgi:voltage-gated potassium channel|uniref:ion transporter n=1 Tax=unclassified Colwellia TaxID=196834 RepID=UPI0026E1AD18|nr:MULTISPECIES: ion transporter [unclassified Colwellia]MDO6489527.1 ion transporter [Colwellia sp. 6_MG-2023]MDO6508610.1 ion transporter [Colwellia sp. 5_MG-2023]MDO6557239.1 ion transporter [Colwellia sp. 4_MG-2023]